MDDYTVRSINPDGTRNETTLTAEQAFDLSAGKPIAFTPRDERLLIDEDGQLTHREDARPQYRDEQLDGTRHH